MINQIVRALIALAQKTDCSFALMREEIDSPNNQVTDAKRSVE